MLGRGAARRVTPSGTAPGRATPHTPAWPPHGSSCLQLQQPRLLRLPAPTQPPHLLLPRSLRYDGPVCVVLKKARARTARALLPDWQAHGAGGHAPFVSTVGRTQGLLPVPGGFHRGAAGLHQPLSQSLWRFTARCTNPARVTEPLHLSPLQPGSTTSQPLHPITLARGRYTLPIHATRTPAHGHPQELPWDHTFVTELPADPEPRNFVRQVGPPGVGISALGAPHSVI